MCGLRVTNSVGPMYVIFPREDITSTAYVLRKHVCEDGT